MVHPQTHFSLYLCRSDNVLGIVPCKALSEIQNVLVKDGRRVSPFPSWAIVCFFLLAVGAAGVFSCDRQELDMKGTANSKYDLINYICQ